MDLIKRASPVPLYAQIKEVLQCEIGGKRPGDALPTEPELEKRFGVSRITIRRALDELEADGLIIRMQGRGSFVREPQIPQGRPNLLSWTLFMRQMGYEPRTISCEIDRVEATQEIYNLLGLESGQRVTRIRRLRGVGAEPLCIMTNYLTEELLPDLPEKGLIDDSLYVTLTAHNMHPVQARDKVEARAATLWEAELLHISAQEPLLQVTRLSFDGNGNALDIAVIANRADRYSYTITLGA